MKSEKCIKLLMVKLLLATIFFVEFTMIGYSAIGSSGGGIETKIAIETNMENRLKKVLTEITGQEQMVVMVNVELFDDTQKSVAQEEKKKDIILPGVPVKETMAEKKIEELLTPLGQKALIKRISATVIMDISTPKEVMDLIKTITTGLLGINAERGDELVVRKITFRKTTFQWRDIIYPPHLYWVIGLVLVLLFLITFITLFFLPFQGVSRDLVEVLGKSATASAGGGTAAGGGELVQQTPMFNNPLPMLNPLYPKSTSEEEGLKKRFAFVNNTNLSNLNHILKTETAENIALVVNYLDPVLGNRVISMLTPEIQGQVSAYLSKINLLDSKLIDQIEDKIRAQVGGVVGGEHRIIELINSADDNIRKTILATLSQKEPQIADRVKKQIVTIETIAGYSPESIQTIFRAVNPTMFAHILKTVAQDVRDKIIAVLPAAASARMKQEIEMSREIPPARLNEEKRQIMETIRRLKQEGLI